MELSIGARIREKRVQIGMKQAVLAQAAGISASYLNLIEHDKRRIAGKLLGDIAEALEIDAQILSEGVEVELLDRLGAAAAYAEVPTEDTRQFGIRHPDWAEVIVKQQAQIEALEARVAQLNDRIAHDPVLSASLHDVLSSVTAVRSAAGILNNSSDIEAEWQARFHRNIYEDSQRLAEGAQGLVTYLEKLGEGAAEELVGQGEQWVEIHEF